MSERKIQVWLRPDQAELAVRSLRFVNMRLNKDLAGGAHEHVAGPFAFKRIEEIIGLFEAAGGGSKEES